MGDIDRFLDDSLLDGAAAATFAGDSARVSERHGNWRRNFPAVGLLLDSDEARAHALAGNYATEAREIVGVWLSAFEEASPRAAEVPPEGAAGIAEKAAWVRGFWSAWSEHVVATEDYRKLVEASGDGPRERFDLVYGDLMARYRDEAVAYLSENSARQDEPGRWESSLAPLRAVGRVLEGFFFPGRSR